MVHRKNILRDGKIHRRDMKASCRGSWQVLFVSKTPCESRIIFYFRRKSSNPTLGHAFEILPLNLKKNTIPKNKDFSKRLNLWQQKTQPDLSMLELYRKK